MVLGVWSLDHVSLGCCPESQRVCGLFKSQVAIDLLSQLIRELEKRLWSSIFENAFKSQCNLADGIDPNRSMVRQFLERKSRRFSNLGIGDSFQWSL